MRRLRIGKMNILLSCYILFGNLLLGIYGDDLSLDSDFGNGFLLRMRRHAKPPSIPTAPLDPNDNIHHTLDEVSSILGTLGGAASGAVMGLTGISISDCALHIKEEDLSTITCAQFINKLSQCDSLQHLQPLLQEARRKYRKNPNSREPCFESGKRNGKKRKGAHH